MKSSSTSPWCSFRTLPSAAEAALVSASCLFSLSTLEFSRDTDKTSFALIEREHAGVWRWAIVSANGLVVDDGREASPAQARNNAETAWSLVAA